MRDLHVECDITELRADLSRDLGLHQLPSDQHPGLSTTSSSHPPRLRDDVGSRRPLTFGYRGVSSFDSTDGA